MSARPPRFALRLLARALAGDPSGPAILGDLHEDFVALARARGAAAARRWYRREALRLALGRRLGRAGGGGNGGTGGGRSASETRRSPHRLAELAQDAGYALRSLRGSPGFALFTAAIIGIGVGAAASVFGVLEPLIIAPLPFEDPHELVWIANEPEPGDNSLAAVTSRTANLHDFRRRARSFTGLSGYNAFFGDTTYTLTGAGEQGRLMLIGAGIAHDFLDVLGVRPLHGRGFSAAEGQPGGPRAMILSHGFWQRRFGGDPAVVGRALTINDQPRTVVGVLPPTFDFSAVFSPGTQVDFLLPFPVLAADEGGFQGNRMVIVGRLRAGTTPAAGQAELDAILAALAQEQPNRWGLGAELTPFQQHLAGPYRTVLVLLAAAAGTLLLIVCVNVSNLFLARSPSRARELAVRQALGAPRARLVRQLVLEALAIALAGAAFGSAIAWGVTRWVAASAAARLPLAGAISVDGAVLLFAAGVALLTGLLVGVVPALQVAGGNEARVLRSSGSGSGTSRSVRRWREALVIVEVTFACVLLVAGGLLVRSFRAVLDVDLGFDAANLVAWQLVPGDNFFGISSQDSDEWLPARAAYYAALTQRVAAAPGVDAVGLIDALPLGGRNRVWGYRVLGEPEETERNEELVFAHVIDPGYLPAMRIPLREGRNFSADDTAATQPVILLNESGARRIFGEDSALGRRMRFWGRWEWEVVGIVADVRHLSPELDAGIQVYYKVGQMPDHRPLELVVRSRREVPQVVGAVRAALHDVDPSLPTHDFWTVSSRVDDALATRRFTLAVLAAFAGAAVLLAGLGIYGVLAHAVAERRREIGIRMALGASTQRIMGGVLGRTLLLAGIGVAAGTVLSLWATRLLGSLLFGVGAADPTTFAGMVVVLMLVATCAALAPARRAVRTGARALTD
jgi:predicted permease